MYEKKIEEDLDCGMFVAMKVFGSKWKPCIIDAIERGINRPSQLHKYIPTAVPRVLDMQLRELEEFKVVQKKVYPGFPLKVEYSLTDFGRSTLPIILMLDTWGIDNSTFVKQIAEKLNMSKVAVQA